MGLEAGLVAFERLDGKGIIIVQPLADKLFHVLCQVKCGTWSVRELKNDPELHINIQV